MDNETNEYFKEDAKLRFPKQDVNDLIKLLDEEDEKEYQQFKHLRDIASDKYDFSGFDHVNCYNKENFLSGTLEALEQTRSRLSISTAEKLIDFLFIFGYSVKRIIYIVFSQGYINWNRRNVQNYINRNKYRLEKERKDLMDDLNKSVDGVFQKMKANVMKAEKKSLNIYLSKIDLLQNEIDNVSPVDEPAKFNRLFKTLENLQDKVKSMHGIEALREASMDISKELEKAKGKHALSLGILDDSIKEEYQSKQGEKSIGQSMSSDVHVIS
jgi:hypothetical protein